MKRTNEHTFSEGILTFDPIVLLLDVAKRWLLILLVAVMAGVGTYILKDVTYQPTYKTTTTFVVTTQDSSATVYSNLTSASNLASVFSELLNSSILRKTILAHSDLTSFDGTIQASAIPETNLLTMTVTASDPRSAYLMAQGIIDHHEELTYQVIDGIVLEVLQKPAVPTAPSNRVDASGQMKRMALMASMAAIAVLAYLSFQRDTLRSEAEIRKKLNCSFLGEIGHEHKYKTLPAWIRRPKTSILITNPATSFRFLESIRKLRRRVEQRSGDSKVLMVTSLLENEGKSTVAVNLALALAQKHESVLLIDCDLRKPACHALLEQKHITHGLRDVITAGTPLGDAIRQDKKSGLYMLLETRPAANSGDLLSSGVMQELLQWARQEFDYVVLDMPPMAAVSDAESMTDFADAGILVVRQNVSTAGAVNKAISALERGNSKLLGCVLNNVRSSPFTSGLSYGYGYGYGYGKYGKYGHYSHYGSESSKK